MIRGASGTSNELADDRWTIHPAVNAMHLTFGQLDVQLFL